VVSAQHKQLKILISSNRKGRLVSTGGPVFFDDAKVHTINHYRKYFLINSLKEKIFHPFRQVSFLFNRSSHLINKCIRSCSLLFSYKSFNKPLATFFIFNKLSTIKSLYKEKYEPCSLFCPVIFFITS